MYGFPPLSCGLMAGRLTFAPTPGQIYPREKTDSLSVSKRTRRLFVCDCGCPCFFLAHFLSDICQGVHAKAITSVLLSLIRSHTTFDDHDVIGHRVVKKVKLHRR